MEDSSYERVRTWEGAGIKERNTGHREAKVDSSERGKTGQEEEEEES